MRNYLVFCFIVCLASCGPHPEVSIHRKVSRPWTYDQHMIFPLKIEDTTSVYEMVLDLDHSEDYEYQNLYVKIITSFPDGTSTDDVVSLNLTDGMGSFKGECHSKKCKTPILLHDKFKVKIPGTYTLTIYQHSRKDSLDGVFGADLLLYRADEESK